MESNTNKEIISDERDWKNIHPDFTDELQEEWESWAFTYEETKEWIDIGLGVNDAEFAEWLRDVKKVNTDWVLNENNDQELRKEFSDSKLSKKVINRIKSFNNYELTPEQISLIDQLIPDEELRRRYRVYGLCKECYQPNNSSWWCQPCNAKHFREQFKVWTSGNRIIDEFIQNYQLKAPQTEGVLEWIPYEKLLNIEFLAEGGFGKVYKAEWTDNFIKNWNYKDKKWERSEYQKSVALKILNNSQHLATIFLKEIAYHKLTDWDSSIIRVYGISQDPDTKDYIMVMKYVPHGTLRTYLNNNYHKLKLRNKISQSLSISRGLKIIHQKKLVHKDFHVGNILNNYGFDVLITDLGLCRPINEEDQEGKVFGVLPYVAPEVLRGKSYTQTSDIYSLGIIIYEIFSGKPPYHEYAHDSVLALRICEGLRPDLDNIKLPSLLSNLIKKCWDSDPLVRPDIKLLSDCLSNFYQDISFERDTEFFRQYKEFEEVTKSDFPRYQTHSQAIYTSRLLDYKKLPEPQNSQEINDKFWNSSEYTRTIEFGVSGLNLTDNFNNDETIVSEEKEVELQSQIEIPPKK